MLRPFVSAAGALLLCACAATTPPSASSAVTSSSPTPSPDVPVSLMKDVTRELSLDSYEGRAPGSAGEEKSLAYIVSQFAAAGLKPGNNGSWFQDVPLVELAASNYSPLTVTGGKAGPLSFVHERDFVAASYRVTPQTRLVDSELVFVGYGINAPEKGWNDYAGIDMRGKTAVILINDPDYESPTVGGEFNGRAMMYYGRWRYKYEEAARQGAAGALIIHENYPAAYGWNVVESSWSGPQAMAQTADDGASETQVNGWVQLGVGRRILAAAGQSLTALSAAAKHKGFRAVPLGLKVNLSFDNAVRRFASKNVIGILPGRERPDEYVLHSAHWDHLGHCTPDATGDDICNGAIDNATGVGAIVALAKAHHDAGAARRSLVFIALTAEESGLLGSEYYGANPVYPLARTVGGLNIDAMHIMGPARDVTVIGLGKSELDTILDRVVKDEGRYVTPDPVPEKGYYYRSDHFSLAKRGVPMFYVDGGEDLVNGGRAAGEAAAKDYTLHRYHAPSDEFDENWDWSGATADLRIFYRLGRALADGSDWPNWLTGDEFRAARDKSRAGSQ